MCITPAQPSLPAYAAIPWSESARPLVDTLIAPYNKVMANPETGNGRTLTITAIYTTHSVQAGHICVALVGTPCRGYITIPTTSDGTQQCRCYL